MGIYRHLDGTSTVDGFPGKFSVTIIGSWNKIHHSELNNDGIGCKYRHYVGSVSRGNYGDDEIKATPNRSAKELIEEKILNWVARH